MPGTNIRHRRRYKCSVWGIIIVVVCILALLASWATGKVWLQVAGIVGLVTGLVLAFCFGHETAAPQDCPQCRQLSKT